MEQRVYSTLTNIQNSLKHVKISVYHYCAPVNGYDALLLHFRQSTGTGYVPGTDTPTVLLWYAPSEYPLFMRVRTWYLRESSVKISYIYIYICKTLQKSSNMFNFLLFAIILISSKNIIKVKILRWSSSTFYQNSIQNH
jgi:hypothetical protein